MHDDAVKLVRVESTRGPSWGHPMVVLGTIRSFLEVVLGAILWAFIAKNRQGLRRIDFETPPRRALRVECFISQMLMMTIVRRIRHESDSHVQILVLS